MSPANAHARAVMKYETQNIRRFTFKLNCKFEQDLIQWIESKENIQSYVIDLIRKDYIASTNDDSEPAHD